MNNPMELKKYESKNGMKIAIYLGSIVAIKQNGLSIYVHLSPHTEVSLTTYGGVECDEIFEQIISDWHIAKRRAFDVMRKK